MTDPQVSELGLAIQEVTEKMQLLVREEIALAQAEMTAKIQKLIRGLVAGAIAAVFALFGLIYLLHAASWGVWEVLGTGNGPWLGFLIITPDPVPARRGPRPAGIPLHQEGGAAEAGARHGAGAADPRDRRRRPARTQRHLGAGEGQNKRPPADPRRSASRSRPTAPSSAWPSRSSAKEVAVVTDWRGQLVAHKKQVLIGAAVAGFVLGGGIAGVGRLLRRR